RLQHACPWRKLAASPAESPRRGRRDAELLQEAARPPGPRQRQVAPRACHPDVEQSPLLGELGRGSRRLRRQLLLLQAGQKHRIELEAFRTVVREQMDAARLGAAGSEATPE